MDQYYALERGSAPAIEPLTLEEVKLYLRIDGSDEDTLVESLIAAVRESAEMYLRRSLITQSWVMAFEDYAPARVELPMGPVQSVTAVKSITRAGVETTISSSAYYLAAMKNILCFDASLAGDTVAIAYVAGHGDAATDVPAPIRDGMLCHLAARYENRTVVSLPDAVRVLYAPYRVIAL